MGTFECTCYHPLFLFKPVSATWSGAMLRRGKSLQREVSGRRVLLPVIERYRRLEIPKFFRGDAAFADPKLMKFPGSRGLPLRDPTSRRTPFWSEKSSTC